MDSTSRSTKSGKPQIKEISIKDFVDIFLVRLPIIVIAAVIAFISVFVYGKYFNKPLYKSKATLYVLKQNDGLSSTSTYFNLSLEVVSDCNYILKSNNVLDNVITELKLKTTPQALKGSISTSNPADTRFIEVTVSTGSPELSKKIVDLVCENGIQTFNEQIGYKFAAIYEYGTLPTRPANTIGASKMMIVAAAAGVATYLIFVFIFLLDNKVSTDEDIKKYTGFPIIASIPDPSRTKSTYGYIATKDSTKHGGER